MEVNFIANLILAMFCGAYLNRARGAGLVSKIGFSLVLAWVLTQGMAFPHTLIIALGIGLIWGEGWGTYIGEIVHPGVWEREKEDPVTDFIMTNQWLSRLPDRAWGVVATSVRFTAWSSPLFLYLQNPLWPAMMMAGPLYLLGHYIDEYLDEKDPVNRGEESGWGYGEYFIGAWFVYVLLMWSHA